MWTSFKQLPRSEGVHIHVYVNIFQTVTTQWKSTYMYSCMWTSLKRCHAVKEYTYSYMWTSFKQSPRICEFHTYTRVCEPLWNVATQWRSVPALLEWVCILLTCPPGARPYTFNSVGTKAVWPHGPTFRDKAAAYKAAVVSGLCHHFKSAMFVLRLLPLLPLLWYVEYSIIQCVVKYWIYFRARILKRFEMQFSWKCECRVSI